MCGGRSTHGAELRVESEVEDELVRLGADYSKSDDWAPYVVEDGLLLTGQNPASSEAAAQELLKLLRAG